MEFISILFLLVAAHWVCDYPLQGQFLAEAKQHGPLRVYHLVAHSGIHGAAVFLITGSIWLGLIEWMAHTIIDNEKCRGKSSFAIDQAAHIACKVIIAITFILI